MSITEIFRNNLSGLLSERGMDLETLAGLCGETKEELQECLDGSHLPSQKLVDTLVVIFEVSTGYFFKNQAQESRGEDLPENHVDEESPPEEEVLPKKNVLQFTPDGLHPDAQTILTYLEKHGASVPRAIINGTHLDEDKAYKHLSRLVRRNLIKAEGKERSIYKKYSISQKEDSAPQEDPRKIATLHKKHVSQESENTGSEFLANLLRSFGKDNEVEVFVALADNKKFIENVFNAASYAASHMKKELTIDDIPDPLKQEILEEGLFRMVNSLNK